MKTQDREMIWDVLAGSCAVLAFMSYFLIGKFYHGYWGLSMDDLKPLAFLLFSWLGLAWLRWVGGRWAYIAARLWLWAGMAVGLAVRYGAVLVQEVGVLSALVLAAGVLGLGAWAHAHASASLWSSLRRVIGWVPALVVASPLLVGQWLDGPVVWLEQTGSQSANKVATIVLLYDEMNAQASLGLQKVLQDNKFEVGLKSVKPVHLSTTEVVPQLFSGADFEDARACGLTRICSQTAALDFAQLSVTRRDVDVVGFHHPYCAMQGLRYCKRLTTNRSLFEDGRWDCAWLRMTGVQARWSRADCERASQRTWIGMRDRVIESMWQAPALKEGGVLYVHLPLPHPPADQNGSLAEQYRANLRLGEQVLQQLLDSLAKNAVETRLLIFADHPLRQSMWCSREPIQFDKPCVVDASLADDYVPLIVAAKSGLPDIAHVQTNGEVFDVLRAWLRH